MNVDCLKRTDEPHVHLLVLDPGEAVDVLQPLDVAVRFIRGHKARTRASFFDECAAALQFPPYFGENWDALHDCLTDLSWLRADGFVLCVLDARQLLVAAPARDVASFRDVLDAVLQRWNAPARSRAARPFHLVLQTTPADEKAARARWTKGGWKLHRL